MTLSILAGLAWWPAGVAVQDEAKKAPSAAAIISDCFKHYYEAKSLKGRIHLTQSARGVTISTDTDVQYDRPPNRLYILQRRSGSQGGQWLAVSNGTVFSYNRPEGVIYGKDRYQEAVVQQDGRTQTVPEMYAALSHSLGDRSPVLDIIFANPEVLKDVKAHWGPIRLLPDAVVRDRPVHVITGDYCTIIGQPPTGAFEMDVSPEGDILRYVWKNRYGIPDHAGEFVDVISNWEADVKVNAETDPKLYQTG